MTIKEIKNKTIMIMKRVFGISLSNQESKILKYIKTFTKKEDKIGNSNNEERKFGFGITRKTAKKNQLPLYAYFQWKNLFQQNETIKFQLDADRNGCFLFKKPVLSNKLYFLFQSDLFIKNKMINKDNFAISGFELSVSKLNKSQEYQINEARKKEGNFKSLYKNFFGKKADIIVENCNTNKNTISKKPLLNNIVSSFYKISFTYEKLKTKKDYFSKEETKNMQLQFLSPNLRIFLGANSFKDELNPFLKILWSSYFVNYSIFEDILKIKSKLEGGIVFDRFDHKIHNVYRGRNIPGYKNTIGYPKEGKSYFECINTLDLNIVNFYTNKITIFAQHSSVIVSKTRNVPDILKSYCTANIITPVLPNFGSSLSTGIKILISKNWPMIKIMYGYKPVEKEKFFDVCFNF